MSIRSQIYTKDSWLCDIKDCGKGLVIQPVGMLLSSLENLSFKDILGFMEHIDKALVYAHSKGFHHRDVSPKNIIVNDGRAILIDWGISKPIDEPSFQFTGTALYSSLASLLAHLQNQTFQYRARDDFESLFYSLLYFVLREKLPWAKKKSIEDLYNSKFIYVHHRWEDLAKSIDERTLIDSMHSLLFKDLKPSLDTLFPNKS